MTKEEVMNARKWLDEVTALLATNLELTPEAQEIITTLQESLDLGMDYVLQKEHEEGFHHKAARR